MARIPGETFFATDRKHVRFALAVSSTDEFFIHHHLSIVLRDTIRYAKQHIDEQAKSDLKLSYSRTFCYDHGDVVRLFVRTELTDLACYG